MFSGGRDGRLVAELATDRQPVAGVALGVGQAAGLERDQRELVERRGGLRAAAELEANRERLLEQPAAAAEVALPVGEHARPVKRPRAVRGPFRRPEPERGVEPDPAFRQAAARPPVLGQGAGQADHEGALVGLPGAIQRRDEVVMERVDPLEGREVGPDLELPRRPPPRRRAGTSRGPSGRPCRLPLSSSRRSASSRTSAGSS